MNCSALLINHRLFIAPLRGVGKSAITNMYEKYFFSTRRICSIKYNLFPGKYVCACAQPYLKFGDLHTINQPNDMYVCMQTGLFRTLCLCSENACRSYGTQDKKTYVSHKNIKQKHLIQGVFQEKKERIKESGQILLNDIRETKNKMKEKMEEVIERENIWTVPNLLCVSRIMISPYLGYVITQSNFHLALGLFVFAGITDLIDGWIARTYPTQATKIGSFLDPMADKVLIAILFLTLTYMDFIPVALTGIIIFRDLLLVGAGFYIRYQSLPPPRTLSRYFDVTHATAQLAPTLISKVNTAIQLTLVATTLAAPVFNYIDHPSLHVLWYVTAATTVMSACSYVFSRNTYKYLKPRK